ncbi:hypothetical protein HK099_006539 [Clydaea vesicula]|uniref:Uncharacterized protein n=1 Tax=Clydaea vesicula TaxID=447962 RepID=A0AAD5U921_9FUNG|nr:hypothetical protein HK099_006539 [Clydaea vesicula]
MNQGFLEFTYVSPKREAAAKNNYYTPNTKLKNYFDIQENKKKTEQYLQLVNFGGIDINPDVFSNIMELIYLGIPVKLIIAMLEKLMRENKK